MAAAGVLALSGCTGDSGESSGDPAADVAAAWEKTTAEGTARAIRDVSLIAQQEEWGGTAQATVAIDWGDQAFIERKTTNSLYAENGPGTGESILLCAQGSCEALLDGVPAEVPADTSELLGRPYLAVGADLIPRCEISEGEERTVKGEQVTYYPAECGLLEEILGDVTALYQIDINDYDVEIQRIYGFMVDDQGRLTGYEGSGSTEFTNKESGKSATLEDSFTVNFTDFGADVSDELAGLEQ